MIDVTRYKASTHRRAGVDRKILEVGSDPTRREENEWICVRRR